MITQAFVLGAGLGTRLRPLTEDLPKPLVPIFQKPLITFAFDHLLAAGCTELIVNTHRLPERFSAAFPDDVYRDVRITFVHEPELLGTGGGIRNILHLLDQKPFVVYSGDILTDFALVPLIEEHVCARNDITLALRETSFRPSIAVNERRVIDIGGKFGHERIYDFANVSIWNAKLAERIPLSPCSFVPTLSVAIAEGASIGGVVVHDGKWFNIGSPQEYIDVHRIIASAGWKPSYLAPEDDWPRPIAADAAIAETARLSGFSAVGSGCSVGADAEIHDTILWAGAQIASRSHLRNCIVRCHRRAQGNLSDTVI